MQGIRSRPHVAGLVLLAVGILATAATNLTISYEAAGPVTSMSMLLVSLVSMTAGGLVALATWPEGSAGRGSGAPAKSGVLGSDYDSGAASYAGTTGGGSDCSTSSDSCA